MDQRTILADDRRGLGAGLLGCGTGGMDRRTGGGLTVFTLGTAVTWYVPPPGCCHCSSAAAGRAADPPPLASRRRCSRQFRKVMPPMSQTEQEALEASGSVWWDASCLPANRTGSACSTCPNRIFSQHERAFLDQQTDTLCRMLDDWRITTKGSPRGLAVYQEQGFG